MDNTYRAFIYSEGRQVDINQELQDETIRLRAKNILNLLGLQRYGSNTSENDDRWSDRQEAWGEVQRVCSLLRNIANEDDQIELIRILAPHVGHWSIWMEAFRDNPKLRRILIDEFPGTCQHCFDDSGNALPRPSGSL